MRPGVGVGEGVGDGVGTEETVGAALRVGEGVVLTVATGPHALATMSATRSRLTELP
jgi:hypothetical protein